MNYSVKWHEKVIEDLKGVDKQSAKGIVQDPISLGKPFNNIFKGVYWYRVGKYKVIYSIDRNENTIQILRVGKRKEMHA